MPKRVLKLNDAGWLYVETDRTPMHVGLLATLRMPGDADADRYVVDLVDRWRKVRTFQPPFNYRQRGRVVPRWELLEDARVDLDHHFRHVAAPGHADQRALGAFVSRLHSARLDRQHPLWECTVIEGVGDRRWSIYMKVHHSQVDGVGGIRLARRIFCLDPCSRDMLPPWAVGTCGPDQSERPPAAAPGEESPQPRSTASVVREGLSTTASLVTSLARTYAQTVTGIGGQLQAVPFRAPRSVLNKRIRAPRRIATQYYALDRMRAVAKAAGGSLNDVFLAMSGAALRRYLTELQALPEESLTANVPVSVRQDGDADVGTAISFVYAKLGTDIEDPVERLRVIGESARLGKRRLPDATGPLMDAYTVLMMGPFLAQAVLGLGGYGPPAFNVVVSNVPGLQEQRYLDGSEVEECYPLSLLFHGQALNITGVSNVDSFCVGYTGCRDALPHLQRIAVYSGEALDELEGALGLERGRCGE